MKPAQSGLFPQAISEMGSWCVVHFRLCVFKKIARKSRTCADAGALDVGELLLNNYL
jgi:hypothetical protein